MTPFKTLIATAALGLSALSATADEVQHYAVEPSETLEQALTNFAEYNAKVREVLAREDLTVADMEEIHEYTYTIEVALAKINEEFGALPETLEALHLASEAHDPDEVRSLAETYFETAGKLSE
jgi:phosphoglycolate phosphatase-like HAD superfamily hydrolase